MSRNTEGGGAGNGPRPWYLPRRDGLAVRVAAFLSLALLPLGLIAIYQTREFQRESEERASLSLLAITGQSAAGLQQAIERALGAAESLGVLSDLLDDPATCSGYLRRYVEEPHRYAFIGFLPGEGPVTCSSAPAPFEIEDREDMAAMMADRRPRVRADPQDRVSGQDVIVVLMPLAPPAEGGNGFDGYLGVSIPRGRIQSPPPAPARPLSLVTFNGEGVVLTAQGAGEGDLRPLLPSGRDLAAEARGDARSFLGQDAMGRERLYTVTPVIPDVAYAMGIWSPAQAARGPGGLWRAPVLFPLLMWVASLLVAFWSIHRQVIRRVAALGEGMRRFARDRSLPTAPPARDLAYEIREIDGAFRRAAAEILQDEARMENAYRERGVLLREVHHRVKNNLQLISSIISMQMRRTPDGRTRAILRRLQDRVLTLATIYRSLYTSADMTSVNAADVLRAIIAQEVEGHGAPAAALDLDDVVLDPDKVVPLAFLAGEAASNALAHAGAAEGRPALAVSLKRAGERVALTVANAAPGQPPGGSGEGGGTQGQAGGQGLGLQLIRAFAAQVGGPATISVEGGTYRLSVTFPVDGDPTERAA